MAKMGAETLLRSVLTLAGGQVADGETDQHLLERFVRQREEAAFSALLKRHGPMVLGVCRRAINDEHLAEDVLQATFLILARNADTIRNRSSLCNWLHGVALRLARKAAAGAARAARRDARPAPDPLGPAAEASWREVRQILDDEMQRLPERYRLPLILCYLEGRTRDETAAEMGCTPGQLKGLLERGRERLRTRLIRRGLMPSVAVAVLLTETALAAPVPPLLAVATLRIAVGLAAGKSLTGCAVAAPVRSLIEGGLPMIGLKKMLIVLLFVVVTGAVGLGILGQSLNSLAARVQAGADQPKKASPDVEPNEDRAKTDKEKPKGDKPKEDKPAERSVPISSGIQTLASASTDIVIADVVETNPTKAGEGARDTVKLKVIRTLLGRPTAGETIGVYYHLLWSDEKREVLESPKFTKSKRYVIFLCSHLSRGPDGERNEYELTDRWLSVLPDHVDLVREVAAAVQVAHGDSRGEWSSTDGSIAGLQGRLIAYRKESIKGGTPIITIYLELRNTSGGNNSTEFLLDGAKTDWVVSDATGKAIAPASPPGNGGPTNRPRKLALDSKESGRLLLTISGGGVAPGGAGHLELGSEQVWEFARSEKGVHSLAGKITIASSGQPGRWYGTLNLPKVRIPLGE